MSLIFVGQSMGDTISLLRSSRNRQSDVVLHHNCDMNSFGKRLKIARGEAGLTQIELARRSGLSQTTISDIERERNSGSSDAAVLASILNVEPLWLSTGKGPRLRVADGAKNTNLSGGTSPVEYGPVPPGDGRLPIRRAMFRASAGANGYEIEYDHGESEPIFMSRRWFTEHRFRPEDMLAVKVSGRSMEPSLYSTDLLTGCGNPTNRPQGGFIFVRNIAFAIASMYRFCDTTPMPQPTAAPPAKPPSGAISRRKTLPAGR